MNKLQKCENSGEEIHLYEIMKCCLHDCNALQCPEPICAMDFPGGVKAYRHYCQLQLVLRSGKDILQAAEELHIGRDTAQRLFKKGAKIQTLCSDMQCL